MYLRNFPRASSMRTDLKTLCRFPSSSTAVMLMLMQHLRHLGKGERLDAGGVGTAACFCFARSVVCLMRTAYFPHRPRISTLEIREIVDLEI